MAKITEKKTRNPRPCPVCGDTIPGHLKFNHIKMNHPELKLDRHVHTDKNEQKRWKLYCVVCGKDTNYRDAKRHINCPGAKVASKAYARRSGKRPEKQVSQEAMIDALIQGRMEGLAEDIAREVLATLAHALEQTIHSLETGTSFIAYQQLEWENSQLRSTIDDIANAVREY